MCAYYKRKELNYYGLQGFRFDFYKFDGDLKWRDMSGMRSYIQVTKEEYQEATGDYSCDNHEDSDLSCCEAEKSEATLFSKIIVSAFIGLIVGVAVGNAAVFVGRLL